MLVKDQTTGVSMRFIEQYNVAPDPTVVSSIQEKAWIVACADPPPMSFIDKLADALKLMAQESSES